MREALRFGSVSEVFATADATERHADLVAAAGAAPWHLVSSEVLDEIADAVTPQGVVARCKSVVQPFSASGRKGWRLVVVCADIRDPGNAGAVVRCADAVNADAVVFTGDAVDPLNPKSVRSSVGSVFHLPILIERDTFAVLAALQSDGLQVFAADGTATSQLFDPELDLTKPTAWLFGNEAWGLPDVLSAAADSKVAVPIFGRAESLNLATATAVCLYASARAQHP